MVQNPLNVFSTRPLWVSDMLAIGLIGVGGYLFFETMSSKRPAPLKGLSVVLGLLGLAAMVVSMQGARTSPLVYFGLAFAGGAAWFFYEGMNTQAVNHYVLFALSL